MACDRSLSQMARSAGLLTDVRDWHSNVSIGCIDRMCDDRCRCCYASASSVQVLNVRANAGGGGGAEGVARLVDGGNLE